MISDRSQFGHWECDLVMFRKEFGKVNVTSLVERVSRFAVVLKNPDRQSKPVMEGLIDSLSPLPAEARRSITLDRGTEFTAWRHLKAGLGVDASAGFQTVEAIPSGWYCSDPAQIARQNSQQSNPQSYAILCAVAHQRELPRFRADVGCRASNGGHSISPEPLGRSISWMNTAENAWQSG